MEVIDKLLDYLDKAYNDAQDVRSERHKKTIDLAVNGFTEANIDDFLLCGMAMGRVMTLEEMMIVIRDIVKELNDGQDK